MSKTKDTATNPALAAAEPMMEWWQKQWSQGATPMARMQLAWMQSMAEAMQFEAELLKTLAENGQKIAQSFDGGAPQTPAEMQEHYQSLMSDLTDAHMERMKRAAELSHEFRRRIWEEI
ncbi:hypothetical protein BOX17_16050 [Halomonas aestuarii]|uniref:Phasin domain-containing protein n=1 Tax=Halomonas aestuarii TaxID=1897729 RepID=A0A1J0VJZ4_9GAMM|nr:hypothetical protein [Halomonas aestuarii]APE32338.1 hypothetical protein BOX17_16050 [Halomonas aestuarii]